MQSRNENESIMRNADMPCEIFREQLFSYIGKN